MQENITVKRAREQYLTHPIVTFIQKGRTDPFTFSLLSFSPQMDVNSVGVPENNLFRRIWLQGKEEIATWAQEK